MNIEYKSIFTTDVLSGFLQGCDVMVNAHVVIPRSASKVQAASGYVHTAVCV